MNVNKTIREVQAIYPTAKMIDILRLTEIYPNHSIAFYVQMLKMVKTNKLRGLSIWLPTNIPKIQTT